ncbi:MAG TPA: hypothetical protein VEQ42_00915 [Pyrinomonadaceae bacterium]|nr:hypothetical protein [Pyrinomonadaceae bacterium]
MAVRNNKRGSDERLELVARAVVRASAAGEAEVEQAASSPFLYARVRSRIAAERARREEGEGWLALLGVVWRAAPAMAAAAVVAFALFLFSNFSPAQQAGFTDETFLSASDVGVEGTVFDRRSTMSSDEVLATLFDAEYGREDQR